MSDQLKKCAICKEKQIKKEFRIVKPVNICDDCRLTRREKNIISFFDDLVELQSKDIWTDTKQESVTASV